MKGVAARSAGAALAAWLGIAISLPAFADRLHLEGGGSIDAREWWVEGATLYYRTRAGTIGIARSSVIKIEEIDVAEPASASTAAPSEPAAAPGPSAPTARIPTEQARVLREAKLALDGRDFRRAADLYAEALAHPDADPDFQLPRVGYALSHIALDEDPLALGVVLDGLARDPGDRALLELLGDLRNREERVPDALKAWRSAFGADPSDRLRRKIEKAERELHAGRDYELRATSHFNLRFDGELEAGLTAAVVEHLEAQFWIVAEALEHTPSQPITVLLYPKREFRDVTQSPEWVGGLYDGKIRAPLGGLRRLDPRAASVLTHELTHAVVHAKTRGNCPRWLHEGLAQRFEGKALGRADSARIRAHLAAGPAAEWESRGFSYPLALSLTEYLEARSGFHRVVDLLDLLGSGASLNSALGNVYGMDYDALCRLWSEATAERQDP